MMSDEDIFRILLSTDNHLGYLEKDPIRGNDSFITFEEILSISENKNPDFILLGGDLFHDNKPSVSSLFKTTELLRKYTFGNKEINFKIISDQAFNFSHSEHFQHSNFNDENLNVGLPIFTIHGNHDDPIDQTNLCALDLFHASGLVNLFGKTSSIETIVINPVLLRKGKTKIALYGLGAIRNERLHRLFQQKNITFLRPTEDSDNWFSIFVIHQNRVKHGPTNYIPENFLPTFFDLIIWGHEHDCRIDPEYNTAQEFYVCQPGSSVATSLCDGEALTKYIGLLYVNGKDFKIEKIKLKTVRPFVMNNVILEDEESLSLKDPKIAQKVELFCHNKVQEMLIDVNALITDHTQQPKLPLLRLSVDYSGGFEMFSVMRFGQKYVDKVANAKDLLVMHRKRDKIHKEVSKDNNIVLNVSNIKNDRGIEPARVEDLINQHLSKQTEKLRILNAKELGVGLKLSVDKDNKEILERVVNIQSDRISNLLTTKRIRKELIVEEIQNYKELFELTHDTTDQDDEDYILEKLKMTYSNANSSLSSSLVSFDGIHNNCDDSLRKGGRGRGSTTRGRGKSTFDSSSTISSISSINSSNSTDSSRKRKTKFTDDESKPIKRK